MFKVKIKKKKNILINSNQLEVHNVMLIIV